MYLIKRQGARRLGLSDILESFMNKNFKRLLNTIALGGALAVSITTVLPMTANAGDISGAGSTFAYPILSKWAAAYKTETGLGLNYQSIGSGGGIKQIKANTVTFGASDMPLKVEDLNASGLVQWPTIIGGVVPVANIPGVKPGELVLDGKILGDIYLGNIKTWNDPEIQKLNPKVKLPATAIAPIYRADGSGTTFLYTSYLSATNPSFNTAVGVNTAVQWPIGIGAKGNEGVAGMTNHTVGAIGYVEYAYAKQNKMTYARMINKDGKVVSPAIPAFQAAAASADWAHAPGYGLVLTNQPGAASWPITGATFVIMHKAPADPAASQEALKFFRWSYKNGGKMATELDYVPIPDSVVKLIESTTWKEIK
jgi:phosphate transport system substrate-binding protein